MGQTERRRQRLPYTPPAWQTSIAKRATQVVARLASFDMPTERYAWGRWWGEGATAHGKPFFLASRASPREQ